jgi:hypothetical protein
MLVKIGLKTCLISDFENKEAFPKKFFKNSKVQATKYFILPYSFLKSGLANYALV